MDEIKLLKTAEAVNHLMSVKEVADAMKLLEDFACYAQVGGGQERAAYDHSNRFVEFCEKFKQSKVNRDAIGYPPYPDLDGREPSTLRDTKEIARVLFRSGVSQLERMYARAAPHHTMLDPDSAPADRVTIITVDGLRATGTWDEMIPNIPRQTAEFFRQGRQLSGFSIRETRRLYRLEHRSPDETIYREVLDAPPTNVLGVERPDQALF